MQKESLEYNNKVLDHYRNPRNFGVLRGANRTGEELNPLCGDDYELFLKTEAGGKVADASFTGQGCAISKASASMLTTLIRGKTMAEVKKIKDDFLNLVTCGRWPEDTSAELKKIRAFEGIRKFPIRVKCATLIWHALDEALKR